MTRAARILLVDDELPIQRALAPLLRSRGYEVDVASSGSDALNAIAARSPDLETMTRRGTNSPSPIKGRLKGLAMGSDSDGPLLAVWSPDSRRPPQAASASMANLIHTT